MEFSESQLEKSVAEKSAPYKLQRRFSLNIIGIIIIISMQNRAFPVSLQLRFTFSAACLNTGLCNDVLSIRMINYGQLW